LIVVGHCLSVAVLLLVLGGALVTSNVREALALRDAGQPPPAAAKAEPRADGGPEAVNQIPRVRVAAIVMPLGVGFLLLVAGILAGATGSAPAAHVAATLAGVAGVLMFLLGLEYIGSLVNWGADSLGGSVATLFASGLACVSLPLRLWWYREDVSDRVDNNND
jgi:hypothetical protein